MKYFVYLSILIYFLVNVSCDNSASFCLCALKKVLEDYTLLTTNIIPPRYRPIVSNDIGFYVVPSKWKIVNSATWSELAAMINAPEGMYTHISLDGIKPINNGLSLDSIRSTHLTDIITQYRLMINKINLYHENIIQNRTKTCLNQGKKSFVGFDLFNNWKKYF